MAGLCRVLLLTGAFGRLWSLLCVLLYLCCVPFTQSIKRIPALAALVNVYVNASDPKHKVGTEFLLTGEYFTCITLRGIIIIIMLLIAVLPK